MILFLDFDGVLHPAEVYRKAGQFLCAQPLFCWADPLIECLHGRAHVQIVISSTWPRVLGFQRARDHLPKPLRERVIGATWHSAMRRHPEGEHLLVHNWYDQATRYEQILRWVTHAEISSRDWVALDDQPTGWPSDEINLIRIDPALGLSDPTAIRALAQALEGVPRD